jgi:glycosyltransferase involved in cell wall biosynthesis
MALGVTVVASDIGPVREIVEDRLTGLLVPSEDVTGLAAALRLALEDRDMASELAANAASRFRECHTIDAVAARMVDLYRELAAGT